MTTGGVAKIQIGKYSSQLSLHLPISCKRKMISIRATPSANQNYSIKRMSNTDSRTICAAATSQAQVLDVQVEAPRFRKTITMFTDRTWTELKVNESTDAWRGQGEVVGTAGVLRKLLQELTAAGCEVVVMTELDKTQVSTALLSLGSLESVRVQECASGQAMHALSKAGLDGAVLVADTEALAQGANSGLSLISLPQTEAQIGQLLDTLGLERRNAAVVEPTLMRVSEQKPWLDETLQLPGGYQTTRRDIVRLLPLIGGLGCAYIAASRMKAMSYVSPRAFLNTLLPPDTSVASTDPAADRLSAFKRYIGDLERRGGGQIVPDFPAGADWFNSGALSLNSSLKGRLVLLDFWTFCCINCLHVLPRLAALEEKYEGQPVVVVGVHSAKFDNERDSTAIRDAVRRYGIAHPVLNDKSMDMWGALGVSSWPTLALIGPTGKLLLMLPGESAPATMNDMIAAALEYYGERGLLDTSPLNLPPEGSVPPINSPLRYPGKLIADAKNNRLFISDSANHRIVITTLSGDFVAEIGGNGPGFMDGPGLSASFLSPQGLAYCDSTRMLYVADTGNHAVRSINLDTMMVSTMAGDGMQGQDYRGGSSGRDQPLNTPWDLSLSPDGLTLYIAMAGSHQIWAADLIRENPGQASQVGVLSGNGYERNQNGSSALSTSWAQPSGIVVAPSGDIAYIADSESSSLRTVDLSTGAGRLLAGGDALLADNLFRFGDRDGRGSEVLLQHPLAVALLPDGRVLMADSYNHKIKMFDPASGVMSTVAGTGRAGLKDGPAGVGQLSEPAGISVIDGNTVLVADTNNSKIRVLEIKSGNLSTLELKGVPDARTGKRQQQRLDDPESLLPAGSKVVKGELALDTAGRAVVRCRVTLPSEYHLTPGVDSGYVVQVLPRMGPKSEEDAAGTEHAPGALMAKPTSGTFKVSGDGATLEAEIDLTEDLSKPIGDLGVLVRVLNKIYYCKQNDVCLAESISFDALVWRESTEEAHMPSELALGYSIPAPKGPSPGFQN